MRIRYKCKCMQDEGSFEVRYRRADEDLEHWLGVMQAALSADHMRRSPLCCRGITEYVKVPTPENAPALGAQPVTH